MRKIVNLRIQNGKKNSEEEVTNRFPTLYHNTLCIKCLGTHVCHENCKLEHASHGNRTLFQGCECMGSNQICKQCTHKPEDHFHEFAIYKKEKKTVEIILEDIKAKYLTAGADLIAAQESSNQHQDDLNLLMDSVNGSFTEIQEHFKNIRNLCPGFNFILELYAIVNTLSFKIKYLPNNCEEYRKMDEKITSLRDSIQRCEKSISS